ncbi:serine hydrolase domain-containing protein [Flavobacterium silvaticum]|uniref:Serine hydrolase n=1 Tax=Flavobacterium silvaticum TaxID=1852020 RepID=A0A972FWF1_9FLAO|nr:serine hydrolase [Flavobacterium silvaticum]NMH29272.1 serine hydrolase [Flavobacterium silvaticum]
MKRLILVPAMLLSLLSCSSSDDTTTTSETPQEAIYFPPIGSDTWQTKSLDTLGWNEAEVQPLLDFLELKHSKSFIVLYNGRIVLEEYFNDHSAVTPWYWASAGKTLTSTMTGIAQQQGFLSISDPVSDYLGQGWTSETMAQENQISLRHLLTMSSGIMDEGNDDCVSPDCLEYAADAGTRWAYDNVYVKLQDVVAAASGQSWTNYFNTQLRDKIGMSGSWIQTGDLSVYWSTTRSMARFGLLISNNGKWQNEQVVPSDYIDEATHTSQQINKSYGYLWWINGEESYHLPQSQLEIPGSLIPDAPADLFMALGKNDQKIYIVPSKKLVIVRMGDSADGTNFALSDFDDQLWQKINAVID